MYKRQAPGDASGGNEILPASGDASGGNEILPASGDAHYIISPQTGETDMEAAWIIAFLSAITLVWKLCKRMKNIGRK